MEMICDDICKVLKTAYERNWISTRDGNASYKKKDTDYFYITPSGVRKQNLNVLLKLKFIEDYETHSEPWSKLDVTSTLYIEKAQGVHFSHERTNLVPSGELPLHVLLQRKVPTDRVVLHLHPTYIIAAMYAGWNIQKLSEEFPEINRYTRVGPMVPIIPPISKELAIESCKVLNLNENGEVDFDIICLDRHGIISIDKDPWSAFEHVERLEHICKIALASGKLPN